MIVRLSPEQGNLCMVPPHWGYRRESQLQPDIVRDGPSSCLGAAALALGGCGRKGALDLPPNTPPQAASRGPAPMPTTSRPRASRACSIRTYGTDAPPAAAKGSKKSFILDPLLDSN